MNPGVCTPGKPMNRGSAACSKEPLLTCLWHLPNSGVVVGSTVFEQLRSVEDTGARNMGSIGKAGDQASWWYLIGIT